MCPLIRELKSWRGIETVVCVTGQHRQMLDQVLQAFQVQPDYDLSIMKDKQTLFDVTANILNGIKEVLDAVAPDVVLVHGDTSTTFATALACFYLQIPVGHVEAGLRTYNLYSLIRRNSIVRRLELWRGIISRPRRFSGEFAQRGKESGYRFVTGNTAIDALKTTVRGDYTHPELEWAKGSRLILLTAHRRENLGEPMHRMFRAIKRMVDEQKDLKVVYPIHMNPAVRGRCGGIWGR